MKDIKKFSESIICALFVAFTIGIYAPISIYCANAGEYWYNLRMIWHVPAIVFIVISGLGFAITYFTGGRVRDLILGIEMGIGLCFYIQGNFLNLKIGTFNGARIDWSIYKGRMIINAVIWIVIIAICVMAMLIKPTIVRTAMKYLASLLTLMQLVSLIFMVIPTINNEGFSVPEIPTFTTEGLYETGDDNIIVIILDMLDERYVDYAIEEIPEFSDVFDGFEFYDNCSSQYHGTNVSLATSFVSGKYYHNEKNLYEWVEDTAKERLYFDELYDRDYEISMYTEEVSCFPERVREIVTNYVKIPKKFYNTRTIFSLLYKSAGCVYWPDAVKPYIWMNNTSLQGTATTDTEYSAYKDENAGFKEGLDLEHLKVKNDTKQFKIIHLYGMHEAYYTDEWGNPSGEHWDWETGMKACVRIMSEYFECLKENGVYDDTAIIVTGDHGYHCTRGVLSSPGLLLKRKNARGEVTINSCEASLANLPATIADLAGCDDISMYGGVSLLHLYGDTVFERFMYNGTYCPDGVTDSGCLLEYSIPPATNEEFILTDVEYTKDGEKIEHAEYCSACKPHKEPQMEYKWLVDLHYQTSDYPY